MIRTKPPVPPICMFLEKWVVYKTSRMIYGPWHYYDRVSGVWLSLILNRTLDSFVYISSYPRHYNVLYYPHCHYPRFSVTSQDYKGSPSLVTYVWFSTRFPSRVFRDVQTLSSYTPSYHITSSWVRVLKTTTGSPILSLTFPRKRS